MMKYRAAFLVIAAAAFMCGCLPSVHPFFTEESVTELDWVEGEWLRFENDGTVKVYSMVRFSVTPEVNAASTVLIAITLVLTTIAIRLQSRTRPD